MYTDCYHACTRHTQHICSFSLVFLFFFFTLNPILLVPVISFLNFSLEVIVDTFHENKIQYKKVLTLLEQNLELAKNMSLYNNLNLVDCNTHAYWGLDF